MRIGVDGSCWANMRGYGRFAREIVAAMVDSCPTDDFVCFVDEAAMGQAPVDGGNVTLVPVRQSQVPTVAASSDGARSIVDILRFSRAVRRTDLDVFFSPSVYTYFPLPPKLPSVVTVHDAIAERFPELTLPSWRARLFWKVKVKLAIRQSRIVLTVSDYARRDVEIVHGVSSDRIRVAVEAPSAAYRPAQDPETIRRHALAVGVPDGAPWFVYVGGFNPHKNVDLVVRAHARFVREWASDSRPHLLLVGSTGEDVFHGGPQQIRAAVAEAGTSDLVHWPGFVPDDDLAVLLSGALGLVLVSQAEGFGLPAVEAAACGCPVIATTESPLPELLKGGGVFLAPGDEEALFQALCLFAQDPTSRREMGRIALSRARALSWPKAADAAMNALREATA